MSHAIAQGPWALLHTPELMDVVLTTSRGIVARMLLAMPAGDIHGIPDTTETMNDPRRQRLHDRITELTSKDRPLWEKQWMVLVLMWMCPGLRGALQAVSPDTVGAFLDTLPRIMAVHVFGTPAIAATPPLTTVMLVVNYMHMAYFHVPPTFESD